MKTAQVWRRNLTTPTFAEKSQMVDTTPNLSLNKPTVGGDDDVWGGQTNANWDVLDTEVQTLKDGAIPIGTIMLWHNLVADIPDDWGYCDGTVYTRTDGGGSITSPDLKGRFIVGSTGDATGAFPTGNSETDFDDGNNFTWFSLAYILKL